MDSALPGTSFWRYAAKGRNSPGPGTNADLLLLDEPFSGLDPLIRREMQDELLRLQADLQKPWFCYP